MSEQEPFESPTSTTEKKADATEKKMMGGSFAVSLVVHAAILLILGSIVIVPAAMEKLMPVTSVAPPPMEIPEPPPLEEVASDPTEDAGSPIGEVREVSNQESQQASDLEALVVDNPLASAPRMNAISSAGTLSADAFAARTSGAGGQGGSGGGTGRGTGRKTFFGSTEKTDGTLVGRLYDLKQDRSRKKIAPNIGATLRAFVEARFSASAFQGLYLSPTPLYATYAFFPRINAMEGPKAFDVEKEVEPVNFLVHYTGIVAPPTDVMVRFCGYGDDWLIVAVSNKIVLDGSWGTIPKHDYFGWHAPEESKTLFPGANFTKGDWIDWKANDFKKIDIVWSETGAAVSSLGVYVDIKGRTYKTGADGLPEYPLFRLSPLKVKMPDNPGPYHAYDANGIIFKAKNLK